MVAYLLVKVRSLNLAKLGNPEASEIASPSSP